MLLIDVEKFEKDIEYNYCLNCPNGNKNKWCDNCPKYLKDIMHIIFSQPIIKAEGGLKAMRSNENFISVIDLNSKEVLINVANIDIITESKTKLGEDCVIIGLISGDETTITTKGTIEDIKKKLRMT